MGREREKRWIVSLVSRYKQDKTLYWDQLCNHLFPTGCKRFFIVPLPELHSNSPDKSLSIREGLHNLSQLVIINDASLILQEHNVVLLKVSFNLLSLMTKDQGRKNISVPSPPPFFKHPIDIVEADRELVILEVINTTGDIRIGSAKEEMVRGKRQHYVLLLAGVGDLVKRERTTVNGVADLG